VETTPSWIPRYQLSGGAHGSIRPGQQARDWWSSPTPSSGRLSFIPLLVIDEVGYIPFDPEAANLMFSLLSARYERACLIVTSNKPFSAWGEIFGDEVTVDRLVHHAEILSLKGNSYRLQGKDLGAPARHD
jgi:hypothetical protein